MTEETTSEAAPDTRPEREIEFAGRTLWVRMPNEGQLVVWQRTLRQLQNAETASWTGEQALAAAERAYRIIGTVLVNKADQAWLDDQLLDEALLLADLTKIIHLTVEAFGTEPVNREQKRATDKAARKTRRKKVEA